MPVASRSQGNVRLYSDFGRCGAERELSAALAQTLSWKPRIFLLHNLLLPEECDALIELGRPQLEASTVVDTATGEGMLSQVRTSSGMFITEATPVTQLIRQRVAHLTLLPGARARAFVCTVTHQSTLKMCTRFADLVLACRGKSRGYQHFALH